MSQPESSQLASKCNETERDVNAERSFENSLITAVSRIELESSAVVDDSIKIASGGEKKAAAGSISVVDEEFLAGSATIASGDKDQSVEGDDKESTANHSSQEVLKSDVMTIIEDLNLIVQNLPGNLEILRRLKGHLRKASNLLLRIEDTIKNQQLEEKMNLETSSESLAIQVAADEGSNRKIRVKSRASCSQEDEYSPANNDVERSLELKYVDLVLLAAKLRQRMEEDKNKLETEEETTDEPDAIAVKADEERTEEDDMRLQYPPISGKYTLALSLYNPESSSSDDSQTPESTKWPILAIGPQMHEVARGDLRNLPPQWALNVLGDARQRVQPRDITIPELQDQHPSQDNDESERF